VKLSMPLAHPSALDRRPREAASYVEGCWSPVPNGVTVNWQAKATRTYTRAIQ